MESAATRAFARQVNKEKREEEEGKLDSNPRLASFVSKIEQSGAKPDPPKPNGSLVRQKRIVHFFFEKICAKGAELWG